MFSDGEHPRTRRTFFMAQPVVTTGLAFASITRTTSCENPTPQTQNPVLATGCRFKSDLRYFLRRCRIRTSDDAFLSHDIVGSRNGSLFTRFHKIGPKRWAGGGEVEPRLAPTGCRETRERSRVGRLGKDQPIPVWPSWANRLVISLAVTQSLASMATRNWFSNSDRALRIRPGWTHLGRERSSRGG